MLFDYKDNANEAETKGKIDFSISFLRNIMLIGNTLKSHSRQAVDRLKTSVFDGTFFIEAV